MDDRAWRKIFGIMSIPVIINVCFLFVNSTGLSFKANIGVLIFSFLLFIAARVWEMKGIDVMFILLANVIILIWNLLCWFNVL